MNTNKFDEKGKVYAKARPDYPKALFEFFNISSILSFIYYTSIIIIHIQINKIYTFQLTRQSTNHIFTIKKELMIVLIIIT